MIRIKLLTLSIGSLFSIYLKQLIFPCDSYLDTILYHISLVFYFCKWLPFRFLQRVEGHLPRRSIIFVPFNFVYGGQKANAQLSSQRGLHIGCHPRCRSLELTLLNFAIDLMIFKDCVALSYRTIYYTCKEFHHLFGLRLSLEKYEFFAEGIPNKQSNSLATISRFHVRLLLNRHLGVLVISTCLHLEDCQALVDKITRRVHSWTLNSLSYVGTL